MPTKPPLTGEDKVILGAIIAIVLIIFAADFSIIVSPVSTVGIAGLLAGATVAIGSLAARHPPPTAPQNRQHESTTPIPAPTQPLEAVTPSDSTIAAPTPPTSPP